MRGDQKGSGFNWRQGAFQDLLVLPKDSELVPDEVDIGAIRYNYLTKNVEKYDGPEDGWVPIGEGAPSPSYETDLSAGQNALIEFSTHNIASPRGIQVMNADRAPIEVYFELRANDDVYIEANIDLFGYRIKIY